MGAGATPLNPGSGGDSSAVAVSVIVPARNAAETIGRTLAALAAQRDAPAFEVIVVDSGSCDATVTVAERAGARVLHNPGGEPAGSRNHGARAASGDVLAFTDADCEPEPDWLASGVRGLAQADVVQGRVLPVADGGPYDRTVSIGAESGLYETANLFVARRCFESLGGFAPLPGLTLAPIPGTGDEPPFGEDAWFAWRARRAGARTAFRAEATVRHAVFARDRRAWIAERWRCRHFPALVRAIPELRGAFLHRRWFLSAASLRFDLALLGTVCSLSPRTRRAAAALLTPYALDIARDPATRAAGPSHRLARLGADALTFAALARGSVAARTVVL